MNNKMKPEDKRYFQFPLCLLRNILTLGKEGYNLISSYAIVSYAIKWIKPPTSKEINRQLLYDFYRNKNKIQYELLKWLEELVEKGLLTYDDEYEGFSGRGKGSFTPHDNIDELNNSFSDPNNSEKLEMATLHLQIHQAERFLCVKNYHNDVTLTEYDTANKQIEEHQIEFGNDSFPGMETGILFDFRDRNNSYENEIFCACVAIRSLIGEKDFVATNYSAIAMRMIGAKNKLALNKMINANPLIDNGPTDVYHKYSGERTMRYWMTDNKKGMIVTLLRRGLLRSKMGFKRKIFLSVKCDHKQLAEAIFKWQIRNKKDYKEIEREAKQILQNKINQYKQV